MERPGPRLRPGLARLAMACQASITARTIASLMLSEARARQLLEPFGLSLSDRQLSQTLEYLDLLLRWNQKINLSGIRAPEECLSRHFGESFYIARWIKLEGRLLDIGSGAGFPGLALKIVYPQLAVTLLEPNAKKRAFLKEVARTLALEFAQVLPDRLEQYSREAGAASFDAATSRAVGNLSQLVPQAARCVQAGGRICLWATRTEAASLPRSFASFEWVEPINLPCSRDRVICIGVRKAAAQ